MNRLKGQKSLIVIVGILGVVFFIINFFLIKDFSKYLELKERFALQKKLEMYALDNKEDLERNLFGNEKIAIFLPNFHDKVDLKIFLENYGHILNISLVKSEKIAKNIIKDIYSVDIIISSPSYFFKLIKDIDTKGLPIKISYPVIFQKREDGIELSLELFLYSFSKN